MELAEYLSSERERGHEEMLALLERAQARLERLLRMRAQIDKKVHHLFVRVRACSAQFLC